MKVGLWCLPCWDTNFRVFFRGQKRSSATFKLSLQHFWSAKELASNARIIFERRQMLEAVHYIHRTLGALHRALIISLNGHRLSSKFECGETGPGLKLWPQMSLRFLGELVILGDIKPENFGFVQPVVPGQPLPALKQLSFHQVDRINIRTISSDLSFFTIIWGFFTTLHVSWTLICQNVYCTKKVPLERVALGCLTWAWHGCSRSQ